MCPVGNVHAFETTVEVEVAASNIPQRVHARLLGGTDNVAPDAGGGACGGGAAATYEASSVVAAESMAGADASRGFALLGESAADQRRTGAKSTRTESLDWRRFAACVWACARRWHSTWPPGTGRPSAMYWANGQPPAAAASGAALLRFASVSATFAAWSTWTHEQVNRRKHEQMSR